MRVILVVFQVINIRHAPGTARTANTYESQHGTDREGPTRTWYKANTACSILTRRQPNTTRAGKSQHATRTTIANTQHNTERAEPTRGTQHPAPFGNHPLATPIKCGSQRVVVKAPSKMTSPWQPPYDGLYLCVGSFRSTSQKFTHPPPSPPHPMPPPFRHGVGQLVLC